MATKIDRPAIKTRSGKVVRAPRKGMRHTEINATGTRGFVTTSGRFVGRVEGARIAKAAGQVGNATKRLHSEHLPEFTRKKPKR
jgi:hypothetical protein